MDNEILVIEFDLNEDWMPDSSSSLSPKLQKKE